MDQYTENRELLRKILNILRQKSLAVSPLVLGKIELYIVAAIAYLNTIVGIEDWKEAWLESLHFFSQIYTKHTDHLLQLLHVEVEKQLVDQSRQRQNIFLKVYPFMGETEMHKTHSEI